MHPNGSVWKDTQGNPIQCHAGSIHFFDGKYYWYGENKAGCGDARRGSSKPRHAGLNCYSSSDLLNWTFESAVLPASTDPAHDLYFNNILDRPHVLYNRATGQYVMWMKVVQGIFKKQQKSAVAVADSPTGPFTYQGSFLPCGIASGDANFFVEDRNTQYAIDGQVLPMEADFIEGAPKAYWIFSEPHRSIVVADLTEDYLGCTGMYSQHLPQPGSPLGREAPMVFYRDWKYHIVTSGTSGYASNALEWASADLIHNEWTTHGNPCVGEDADNTFGLQFASVLELPDRPGCFVGLADMWDREDIENSGYALLPFRFREGRLEIEWCATFDPSAAFA
ncbi:MAG: family 43 glycosylhydrolase [Opitutales bacterium]